MQISAIKGFQMDLTPAIEQYASEKLFLLEKLTQGHEPVRVVAEVGRTTAHHQKGQVFFAEFHLHMAGAEFHAREEREDLYEAIDVAKDELKRQIAEFKDRQIESHRTSRPDKV